MNHTQNVSIILPCLNEKDSIVESVMKIAHALTAFKISGEIIIVDNDSYDGSTEIIKKLADEHENIHYVFEATRGYGSAYKAGFSHAQYDALVMLDCDLTYDFSALPQFVSHLHTDSEFVIGDRFSGKMDRRAMPFLHRYVGNPVLSGLVRAFFGTSVRDVHCGIRGVTRSALEKMNLRTTGMEFASEMVIKAVKQQLAITEIPIDYNKRRGDSKLRSFADGWRHLRFILLYSPLVVFLIPGSTLFVLGIVSMVLIYFDVFIIFGRQFVVHPIFIASLAIITGFQLMSFAGFAKAYAVTHLDEESHILEKIMRYFTIEKAALIGIAIVLFGITLFLYILVTWVARDFGGINQIKNGVIALTAMILGIQIISNAFMTSILGIEED
jgi:glycosyltransferase involved in cell wall biosynthesis